MLYRAEPQPFTARELELATTAAHHVALAVERTAAQHALARAFSVERAAHLEAADATRAREEIISVVSHDLRSPLAAILVGASTLVTPISIRRGSRRSATASIARPSGWRGWSTTSSTTRRSRAAGSRCRAHRIRPAAIVDAASDMFARDRDPSKASSFEIDARARICR